MQKKKKERLSKRKRVIELLRKKNYRYSELVKETGFPEKTMDRILKEFDALDLITKKNDGTWAWYVHVRKPYRTKGNYDVALDHSKKLILGLDAILAEDKQGAEWALEVESKGGNQLKQFAEEHLKTGYYFIYEKLKNYRELRERIRRTLEQKGYPRKIVNFVVNGLATFPNLEESEKWPWSWSDPLPKDVEEALKQKLAAGGELEEAIRFLKWKIIMGEPLDGICKSCPDVSILE